jgi:hypothetical protein
MSRSHIKLDVSWPDLEDAARDLRIRNPHLSKDECCSSLAFLIAQIQQGWVEIEGGIPRSKAAWDKVVEFVDLRISAPAGVSLN